MTVDEWKKVLWSDELRFNLCQSDERDTSMERTPFTRMHYTYSKETSEMSCISELRGETKRKIRVRTCLSSSRQVEENTTIHHAKSCRNHPLRAKPEVEALATTEYEYILFIYFITGERLWSGTLSESRDQVLLPLKINHVEGLLHVTSAEAQSPLTGGMGKLGEGGDSSSVILVT
ncbi:hypothetical protein TNCV_4103561 [Trichonephila clavipes]|nr:hypothetical protein TNCV_4103561 [Trichonephila clavipes]